MLQHSVEICGINKMNNICDLYLMYLGKRNLYGEVTRFRKQENHSENFEAIMNWLKDLIKLCENTDQSHITADMIIKTGTTKVKITAKVIGDDCRVYRWEWPDITDA